MVLDSLGQQTELNGRQNSTDNYIFSEKVAINGCILSLLGI